MTEKKGNFHQPVLLAEVIQGLQTKPDGIYLDGTFGRGGHAKAILSALSEKGQLWIMDKDPAAIEYAKQIYHNDSRCHIHHGSFIEMEPWAKREGIYGKVNGILLDLGVSSPQLEEASRGFGFSREGPLDMRMNTSIGIDAGTWLKDVDEGELARVLKVYGEERYAKRIARAIVEERQNQPILTTKQLATIISKANPSHEKHHHPATRAFLAIRLFINQELEELAEGLKQGLEVLAVGGRLAVISFHSREDRVVKNFIREFSRGEMAIPGMPVLLNDKQPRLRHLGKAIKPSDEEIKHNKRARSALLRLSEKIL